MINYLEGREMKCKMLNRKVRGGIRSSQIVQAEQISCRLRGCDCSPTWGIITDLLSGGKTTASIQTID
jgi:hypothetical protein